MKSLLVFLLSIMAISSSYASNKLDELQQEAARSTTLPSNDDLIRKWGNLLDVIGQVFVSTGPEGDQASIFTWKVPGEVLVHRIRFLNSDKEDVIRTFSVNYFIDHTHKLEANGTVYRGAVNRDLGGPRSAGFAEYGGLLVSPQRVLVYLFNDDGFQTVDMPYTGNSLFVTWSPREELVRNAITWTHPKKKTINTEPAPVPATADQKTANAVPANNGTQTILPAVEKAAEQKVSESVPIKTTSTAPVKNAASPAGGRDRVAVKSSCKVLDPKIRGTYEGGCLKGLAHGTGKSMGTSVYSGEFVKGYKHGHGIESDSDGNVYEGEFFNDKWNGQGVLTLKNFDRIEGDFLDGWARIAQVFYASGDRYDGEMHKDSPVPHGRGTYTWKNQDRYEGDFIDGKRSGKGNFTWINGNWYEGDFIDSKITGKGIFTWQNGDRYEGDFVDGKRTGKGIYIWKSGSRYEGDFINGKRTGRGTYTWPNGEIQTGNWVDGKQEGIFTAKLPDGSRREFLFENGVNLTLKREQEIERARQESEEANRMASNDDDDDGPGFLEMFSTVLDAVAQGTNERYERRNQQAAFQRQLQQRQAAAERQRQAEANARAQAAQEQQARQRAAQAQAAAEARAREGERQAAMQAEAARQRAEAEAQAAQQARERQERLAQQEREAQANAQRQMREQAAASQQRSSTSNLPFVTQVASKNNNRNDADRTESAEASRRKINNYLLELQRGAKFEVKNCAGDYVVAGRLPRITPQVVSCVAVHYRAHCLNSVQEFKGVINNFATSGGGCFGDTARIEGSPICHPKDMLVDVTEVTTCQ